MNQRIEFDMLLFIVFIVAFFTVPAAMYWFNAIDEWVEKRRQRDEYDFTFTGGERKDDGKNREIDEPIRIRCENCVYYGKECHGEYCALIDMLSGERWEE